MDETILVFISFWIDDICIQRTTGYYCKLFDKYFEIGRMTSIEKSFMKKKRRI